MLKFIPEHPVLDDCISVSQTLLQKGYQLESTWDAPFAWNNENSKENIWVIPNDEIVANEMMSFSTGTIRLVAAFAMGLEESEWGMEWSLYRKRVY